MAKGLSASTMPIGLDRSGPARRRTIATGCAPALRISVRRDAARGLLDSGGFGSTRARSYEMTTLKVGIASYEDMKARTMRIARGEKPARGAPKVWFTSTESFSKVLSAGNRELLRII